VIYTGVAKIYFERGKNAEGGINIYKSQKCPLYSKQGKIIGVFGISTVYNDQILLDNIRNKENFIIKFVSTQDDVHSSMLGCLSRRQIECLFHVLRGMTIKEIAICMRLSPRTIEHYLETVKDKLNCKSRSQLVAKVVEIVTTQPVDC